MNPTQSYRNVVKSKDKETYAEAALALRRWIITMDPHRPIYHFTGPESWVNDANGPIFYRGRYHLFYQFDPIVEGRRSPRCWGHAVSDDLVHWEDWPVALWPDTSYDRNGVYSGNTVVDDQGRLCALYTGNVNGHKEAYGLLARSTDEGLTWQKMLVMDDTQRPNANSPVHWDGFLWREGRVWQQLVGGATEGDNPQGAAWLWRSDNLEEWRLEANIAPNLALGKFWELPYLIHLGGRDLLLVGNGNPYWFGRYDPLRKHFRHDESTPFSMDNGDYYSFNVNMTDTKGANGGQRRLMHGWITGPPSPTAAVPYWQGIHSIPRVITHVENRVWQEPIPEIRSLRGVHTSLEEVASPGRLPVQGDALEMLATFQPGSARRFGFKLRVSNDGTDFVRVFYDTETGEFGADGPTIEHNLRTLMLGNGRAEIKVARQPSLLQPGQAVTLHIFLDRSLAEVFVNGCAYTARFFSPADALHVEYFAEEGSSLLKRLDIWQMKSMWT